ncbi:MAG TPA: branched-chain amino acid ABC transporter permease [Thermodesulfobacteriota bacterium]|nr:branched-chain amino acid ABC transporter permease [Thermodesulfobacteriota bacterium]
MSLPSGVFSVSYIQDMMILRTRFRQVSLLIFLLFLFCIPLFARLYWVNLLSTIAATVIALMGLNILSGYCGQISVGHSAFMAIGAYTSAVLAGHLGLPFWLCLPCAGLTAGLMGILFGLPSLKVKGLYLSITTIAAQFIIIYLIKTPFADVTGGAIAMNVPPVTFGAFVFQTERQLYYLVMAFTILMTFFAWNLTRSHVGRAFVAIHNNDIAAEAMGINLYSYKLLAFFIGCFYAGISGSLWSVYAKVISPDDFTLMNSIWQIGMLIIGGMGSTLGPFLGAAFITALNEIVLLAGPMITSAIPQIGAQVSAALVEMIFGAVLVVFLIYEPRGLAHRWEILKQSCIHWPFSY